MNTSIHILHVNFGPYKSLMHLGQSIGSNNKFIINIPAKMKKGFRSIGNEYLFRVKADINSTQLEKNVTIRAVGPALTIGISQSPSGNVEAGDTVTYTGVIAHGSPSTEDARNLKVKLKSIMSTL